jgi:hypothetical protein
MTLTESHDLQDEQRSLTRAVRRANEPGYGTAVTKAYGNQGQHVQGRLVQIASGSGALSGAVVGILAGISHAQAPFGNVVRGGGLQGGSPVEKHNMAAMHREAWGLHGRVQTPAPTPRRTRSATTSALFEAAAALQSAALAPQADSWGQVTDLLRRAIGPLSEQRPRHAAVAVSVWDALMYTPSPFSTSEQRSALFTAALLLTSPFISTEQEMHLLDVLDDAGFERVPPFELTTVGRLVNDERG